MKYLWQTIVVLAVLTAGCSQPKTVEGEAATGAAENGDAPVAAPADASADANLDWPMWGRTAERNMSAADQSVPMDFEPGKYKGASDEIDPATMKKVKWLAKLGSQTYGNPTIGYGHVLVGTNNEFPRDEKHQGDRGILMCLDDADGSFKWQLVVPKLGAGKVSDWEYLGICSSAAMTADKAWIVTNRCEVVCVDMKGMANGNQGMQDEGKFITPPGKPLMTAGPKDADILWSYDMRAELGVFPHNITSSSPLLVGDKLYVVTSNGQDWSHVNIPAPRAPTLIALDANTGELLAEEASGVSTRIMHCNWSSPTYGKINDQEKLIFGAGDGFVYSFDPKPVNEDDFMVFKENWRFDCNPIEYKEKDGKKIKYPRPDGPSEIIATPVVYKDKVYALTGQDPEHGEGVGILCCIDASGKKVWDYRDINRSISTVSIHDDLVYAADYAGYLHCLDANTGKFYWKYDTQSHIWSSPLVVGDYVLLGNEDAELVVLKTGKTLQHVRTAEFPSPIYSSPVVANNVLYVATQTHLFAIGL
jgi:outer membrane protein assembly factor BamB